MKHITSYFCLTFLFISLYSCAIYNIPGTLDPSFGGNPSPGIVVTNLGANDDINAIIRQPNHKLVAAGRSGPNFALVRYNSDGSLDATFNGTGIVITDFDGESDSVNALIIQPDGKLVAAGQASIDGNPLFALARYNSDGSLDATFGTGGKVTTSFPGSFDIANALIIQPDGKLVAAGQTSALFALARYNSDGTLDTSFGNGGKVTTDFGPAFDVANALIVQPDGKLVAAGRAFVDGQQRFALARYNTDGSLDNTFGDNGRVIIKFNSFNSAANALILQPDGKLVAAGDIGVDFGLARYNSDGTLDTTFNNSGFVVTDFQGSSDQANALILQPDGKLIAAGIAIIAGQQSFALARYNANGILDITFNPNGGGNVPASNPPGTVVTQLNGGGNIAHALILQTEGTELKLVAAGESNSDFGLAQYFAVHTISPLASNVIAKYCLN